MKFFVIYYRKHLDPKFQKLKIVQLIKSTKFYSVYKKFKQWGNNDSLEGRHFLAILATLILVLSLIFTDRWLENQLEEIGSQIVGARVEIDGLDLSLFGAQLKIEHLQVTDSKHTMRNLLKPVFVN